MTVNLARPISIPLRWTIGAALVRANRDRGYRVVATARSVQPPNDADILIVPGDIAERTTAQWVATPAELVTFRLRDAVASAND